MSRQISSSAAHPELKIVKSAAEGAGVMRTAHGHRQQKTIGLARRADDDGILPHRTIFCPDQVEKPVLVLLESAPAVKLALELIGFDFARGDLLEHLFDFLPGADGNAAVAHTEHAPRAKLLRRWSAASDW